MKPRPQSNPNIKIYGENNKQYDSKKVGKKRKYKSMIKAPRIITMKEKKNSALPRFSTYHIHFFSKPLIYRVCNIFEEE